jgi:shikimate dehydrogenase
MSRKVKTRIQKRYCVIGYPIKHSLSPKLHNAAFRKLKIPARYEAVEVKPAQLKNFMRDYRQRYAGGNVTIPHKRSVMKYLDRVSPEAKKIGAVNTIVNRGGKLIGYNTDVYGAMEALRAHRGAQTAKGKFLNGQKVVVLGAGGAARAVVYGLKKAGARVVILNRTLSHAKKLAKEFGCAYAALSPGRLPSDLLINTTSVGMWPKTKQTPLLLSPAISSYDLCVFDIIYRPRITQLLRDAKRAGCKIITGDCMFFAQAAKSFELWTGTRPKFTKL